MRFAGAGIARGNRRNFMIGLTGTIILGAIFLGGQIYEYGSLFGQHFTPQTQAFGSAFFTLTGFHGLHVTIGIIFLLIMLIRSLRGDFTAKNHFGVQTAEMYWHFVDVVWVVVFSTVYFLPLIKGHSRDGFGAGARRTLAPKPSLYAKFFSSSTRNCPQLHLPSQSREAPCFLRRGGMSAL